MQPNSGKSTAALPLIVAWCQIVPALANANRYPLTKISISQLFPTQFQCAGVKLHARHT